MGALGERGMFVVADLVRCQQFEAGAGQLHGALSPGAESSGEEQRAAIFAESEVALG